MNVSTKCLPLYLISDHNNNSLDDCPASDLACFACEFVAGHRRELNSHHRVHFVKECSSCSKFIPESSSTSHRLKCQVTPPVTHSCGQCDYKSVFVHAVRDHEKRVHGGEHKCNICFVTRHCYIVHCYISSTER